ncbi:hypothetical protein [Burkholderia vietnamiensis]|uniref:hypothetical protein n=1 Tax=Burkholderia vietnamiensis TaxID=60552 RepID=UPI00075EFDE5|nr:hypothetical protein [Burkholderia vietnamiensis]KVR89573.1 hypothetical protein WK26_27615 [Burkholderia vietnamiensis]HDR9061071.1 hypothetical protein [Burkholderia vietnamiensis]
MSIVAILDKAKSLGVQLRVVGDIVKMKGPADAVATIKPEIAAHKAEIMVFLLSGANAPDNIPADCVGALRSRDGALYLPWGLRIPAEKVDRMHNELIAMIEELADIESWPAGDRDDVLTRAIRGPLADLLPNRAYFSERLTEARAKKAARELADRRAWRFDR